MRRLRVIGMPGSRGREGKILPEALGGEDVPRVQLSSQDGIAPVRNSGLRGIHGVL